MALQNPHLIDLMAEDPASGDLLLGMTEARPWDGSDQRVFELQEKVNAYLSFALDGELAEAFPNLAQKRVRLQLSCVQPPDPKTDYFIGVIREQIGFQGIGFEVKVVPGLTEEASACGCHSTGEGCCGGNAAAPKEDAGDCGQGGCGCGH